jgi:glycerol uptake facilitator-like aquaporin
MTHRRLDRLVAEFLGTALLLATVVGSGIMGVRLAGGSIGLALMANAVATGAMLVVLILVFGPISGAHFNPLVSVLLTLRGEFAAAEAPGYCLAQIVGGVGGVLVAHAMFDVALIQLSQTARSGTGQWIAEFVASFGLLIVIPGVRASAPQAVPLAVGLYILGAYWFTASTSFANPAVTLARGFTDSFAGIALRDVPGFVAAQTVGLAAAALLGRRLWPSRPA